MRDGEVLASVVESGESEYLAVRRARTTSETDHIEWVRHLERFESNWGTGEVTGQGGFKLGVGVALGWTRSRSQFPRRTDVQL